MKKTSFDGFAKCAMCGDSIKAFGKSSLVCSSCHKVLGGGEIVENLKF